MNATRTTAGGTLIFEPSSEEFSSFLESIAQREIGMSIAEFESEYRAGRLDETSPNVSYLAALLNSLTSD
jgi:hypothetical protein